MSKSEKIIEKTLNDSNVFDLSICLNVLERTINDIKDELEENTEIEEINIRVGIEKLKSSLEAAILKKLFELCEYVKIKHPNVKKITLYVKSNVVRLCVLQNSMADKKEGLGKHEDIFRYVLE